MGIKERKERNKEELRKKIIELATKLTIEHGWQTVTVRKIADVIEYSTIKIYSEFGSMEALMLEVQKAGFIKLYALLRTASEIQTSDDLAQLKNISRAMWTFGKEYAYLYQVMCGFNGVICPVNPTQAMDGIRELIKGAIRKVAGTVDNSLSFNWWALIHGYIYINLVDDNKYGPELDAYIEDSIERYIYTIKNQKNSTFKTSVSG